MRYLTDGKRHLICAPYSIENLHKMADDLGINRCWFHSGKLAHYDIPKKRIADIEAKCEMVSTKEMIRIMSRNIHKEFVEYVFGKLDPNDLRRIIDEKCDPPLVLPKWVRSYANYMKYTINSEERNKE